jgi:OPA family glycerol-3-phosphate transporter-like MFS transporter
MLGYSGYYFCRSDFSVALPLILADLVKHGVAPDVAEIRLGSIASLGVLAYAVGKFPSGGLADLFGGSKNFLGGMLGAIFFTIMFMMGGGFPIFTLAWIGNRLVQSLGWAGLVKVTSRWFSYSTYGTVMGILSLSYLFGDAISREIMSVLLGYGFGWRGIFATGATLLLLLFLLNLFFLRESPEEHGLPAPIENPLNLFAGDEFSPERKGIIEILKPLARSRSFWLICMLSLGTTLLRETFNLWTPTYFTQFVGLNNAQAASCSALFPLCGGISVLFAGVLSDHLGPEGRSRILCGGLCLTVIALILLGRVQVHSPRWIPIILVATVALLLIGPYSYLGGAMSLDFGGKEGSATASGLIDGAGYLAGVLSGDSMAHIAVAFGWSTMFTVLAAVAFISSAVAVLFMWHQHQRSVTAVIHSRGAQ